MKTTLALACLSLSLQAFAISGACKGLVNGKELVINVYGTGNDPREATGTLMLSGKEISQFDGQDARLNFFTLSGKITNYQGDYAEGKVTDMGKLKGILTRLIVKTAGIDASNIPLQCWTTKN